MISGCLCSPAKGYFILPEEEAAQNHPATDGPNALYWLEECFIL
jgi:hypothetical protein